MTELECYGTETIFHCYKNGELVDTCGTWNIGPNCEIVETETVDLSGYDEVRMISIEQKVCWESKEDFAEGYKFKCREIIYKMPDGSEHKCIEPDDAILDWVDFEPDGCGNIDVILYTHDGHTDIDVENRIEDDDDLGW